MQWSMGTFLWGSESIGVIYFYKGNEYIDAIKLSCTVLISLLSRKWGGT